MAARYPSATRSVDAGSATPSSKRSSGGRSIRTRCSPSTSRRRRTSTSPTTVCSCAGLPSSVWNAWCIRTTPIPTAAPGTSPVARPVAAFHATIFGMAEDPIEEEEHESAYALLQRGQALIRSRHHAQAAIVLERAARAEPGKGSILEPLGRAYHHSGQFERARAVFDELL